MDVFLSSLLTASVSGSIVILAVLILRLVLRGTPKKYICILWMVAGLRLLLPVPLQSKFSLQPPAISLPNSEAPQKFLLPLWAAIASVLVLVSLCSYIHLRGQVKNARKVRGGWECEGLDTAFVLGFLKPKIYIPAGVSENTRQQILSHERTHLDKGDHWIKLIGFLALVLHWFNPLVWISYVLLCKDIEMACDERVVQFMDLPERKAYSAALLDCSTRKVHYAACPVAFGEVSVKYRIKSVLSYKKPAFWASLLGILAIAFVAVCLGTNPVDKREDPEADLIQSSRETPESFTPAALPECDANPDWGITPAVSHVTTTGGTLLLEIEERFCRVSDSLRIADSALERWNGQQWEALPAISDNTDFVSLNTGFAGSRAKEKTYESLEMNWSLEYGSLSAGDYRIVMTLAGDSQSGAFYAPFHIYREALPSAQEAALLRCKDALKALKLRPTYSLLRSEKNLLNDELSPVSRITLDGQKARTDYFAGEFPASSLITEPDVWDLNRISQQWIDPFQLEEDRRILFPEGQSVISDREVSFRTVWADSDGTAYYGSDSYRFDASGNLASVDRLVTDAAGTVLSHDRLEVLLLGQMSCSSYIHEIDSLDYEDPFTAQEKSPWNIGFLVEDDLLEPTGGKVWFNWLGIGVGNYTADSNYWMEKRTGSNWQRLLGEDVTFPFGVTLSPLSGQGQCLQLDWSNTYGSLESGVYRIGTRFYNGEESIIQYAEFAINPTGGIHGEGGEAAMARIDAALEKLKSGNYHARKLESGSIFTPEDMVLTGEFWQYNGELAESYYNNAGSYSHTYIEATADIQYGLWYDYSYYHQPYESIYFPKGQSVISDREITFLHSYSQTAGDNPLIRYTYRFDGQGNLTEIEYVGFDDTWGGFVTRYVLEDTPDTVIQEKMETFRQENAARTQR